VPLRGTTSHHHEIGHAGFASYIHHGNVPSFAIVQGIHNEFYKIIGIHGLNGVEDMWRNCFYRRQRFQQNGL
jgi:hypothetical protein